MIASPVPLSNHPTTPSPDAIGRHYAAHGWVFAASQPRTPAPPELDAGPTFAGYPCSPTTDDNGLPTWLIVDGKQAQRREKQNTTQAKTGEKICQDFKLSQSVLNHLDGCRSVLTNH